MNKPFIRRKNIILNLAVNRTPGISECFTTRKRTAAAEAKKHLGVNRIYFQKQVHGNKTTVLSAKNISRLGSIKADAVITRMENTAVAVKLADCIGSVIIDPENMAVAAVHSGWRGVAGRIISKTIKAMKKEYGSKPGKLIVSMSACIRPCHYEVGKEVYNKLKKISVFSNIFKVRGGKIYMDMQKGNLNILLKEGVKRKHIYMNKACTMHNEKLFHSYRRDGKKAGRMLQIIMIKKKG